MTKRVLAFTFILAILPFAANAASKLCPRPNHQRCDGRNHRSAQGELQSRMDWNRIKWAGNVHQRQMDQNRSRTYRRSPEQ